jgi:ribosomal protein S18 acetylase RimI-like enzyme
VSVRRKIIELDAVQLPAATQLLMRALSLTPYATGALESLEGAARSPDSESRALACVDGDAMHGVAAFGAFAGADGAARLHFVVVGETSRREGIGRALVEAAIARLRAEGARFVLAELPDDSLALPHARDFLSRLDFREEGRVENFFRDGVSLAFLRRDIARPSGDQAVG